MRDSDHDDAEERAIRKDVRSCIGPTIPLRRRWVDLIMRGPIAALLARARAAEARLAQHEDRNAMENSGTSILDRIEQCAVTCEEEAMRWEPAKRGVAFSCATLIRRFKDEVASSEPARPVGEDALREAFEATVLALGEAVFALRGAGCQRATLKALDAQNRARTALASPTQQAPDQGGGGSGWIIQDPTSLRYRTWAGGPCWTVKEDMALQFHRKADAERFAADDRNPWHVVPATPKANTGEEETLSRQDWLNCEEIADHLRSMGMEALAETMAKAASVVKRVAVTEHLAKLQAGANESLAGDTFDLTDALFFGGQPNGVLNIKPDGSRHLDISGCRVFTPSYGTDKMSVGIRHDLGEIKS